MNIKKKNQIYIEADTVIIILLTGMINKSRKKYEADTPLPAKVILYGCRDKIKMEKRVKSLNEKLVMENNFFPCPGLVEYGSIILIYGIYVDFSLL